MPFCFKAARDLLKTCAAVATLGAVLAPSNALAVTTWNWSFTTDIADQSGSGTFTTADVTPTAGTTYQITGISGTYNRGGTAYTITGLNGDESNQFQWNGTSSSPILTYQDDVISFYVGTGTDFAGMLNSASGGYAPVDDSTSTFNGSDGAITSSSLAPVSPPAPSTAAPGPLPLLGAAAAFQASRRLRRRLSGSLPAA
jgi:hypothetical protein